MSRELVAARFFWLIVSLATLALSGCYNGLPMTNEEIIAENKKCEAAGMITKVAETDDGQVYHVTCHPGEKTSEDTPTVRWCVSASVATEKTLKIEGCPNGVNRRSDGTWVCY